MQGSRPPAQPQDNQHHLQPESQPQPPNSSPCLLLALLGCYLHTVRVTLLKHLSHPVLSLQSLFITYRPCVIWPWVTSNLPPPTPSPAHSSHACCLAVFLSMPMCSHPLCTSSLTSLFSPFSIGLKKRVDWRV